MIAGVDVIDIRPKFWREKLAVKGWHFCARLAGEPSPVCEREWLGVLLFLGFRWFCWSRRYDRWSRRSDDRRFRADGVPLFEFGLELFDSGAHGCELFEYVFSSLVG